MILFTQVITERKQAEEALRESEELFRQLTDNLRQVFWMNTPDFAEFLYISPAYESVWERTRESLYRNPKSFMDAIHPEDRVRAANVIEKERERAFEIEYRILTPDGEVRWIWDRGFPIKNEAGQVYRIAGIAEDITERKLAEDALRESQRQYETLVNTIDGIVWESDAETFRFTFVSRQAERILGYPLAQWFGEKFWTDHLHPEDREWALAFCLDAIARRINHQFEYRMIAADGRAVWLRDYVVVVACDDGSVHLRGVMVDITDRKLAEEELQ